MKEATLRLFNAVQVTTDHTYDYPSDALEFMFKHGFIADARIEPTVNNLSLIAEVVGLSGKQANASFHKSWKIIRESSIEDLVIQQIIHYITTYGFEALGIYDEKTVFVPREELDIPLLKEDVPLIMVRGLTSEEILEKIIDLGSGIALHEDTLKDIMRIVEFNNYDSSFIKDIKNRELKTRLYDYYHIVPQEPMEFLRFVVQKLTGETLIIKNAKLIAAIQASDPRVLDGCIDQAPSNLASIFYRFKPLFLAMRSISRNKTFFNQLRKKAVKMHVPIPEDYFNSVTSQIKNGSINFKEFGKRLKDLSIFRAVRLGNALMYRLEDDVDSIVHRVRNGKGYAKAFDSSKFNRTDIEVAMLLIYEKLAKDISENVNGKIFYIPDNVHYAVPTTEKQFIGNLPNNSYVSLNEEFVVGVHWVNVKNRRTDIDLSLLSGYGKIGWDGAYRHHGFREEYLFSGDLVNAPKPHGASELFYVKSTISEPSLLMANYFNYSEDHPIPTKLFVADYKTHKFNKNFMVDPNKIIMSTDLTIVERQNAMGFLCNVEGENRFYFTNVSVGKSRTSYMGGESEQVKKYMFNSTVNTLNLRDVLVMAGAEVIGTKPEEDEYVDLSPEAIDKTSIINLFQGK